MAGSSFQRDAMGTGDVSHTDFSLRPLHHQMSPVERELADIHGLLRTHALQHVPRSRYDVPLSHAKRATRIPFGTHTLAMTDEPPPLPKPMAVYGARPRPGDAPKMLQPFESSLAHPLLSSTAHFYTSRELGPRPHSPVLMPPAVPPRVRLPPVFEPLERTRMMSPRDGGAGFLVCGGMRQRHPFSGRHTAPVTGFYPPGSTPYPGRWFIN